MRYRPHQRVAEPGKWLKSVVAGYFAYHAVPTNARGISAFRYHVIQMWLKSLRRRSQRHNMPWERMNRIIDAWIPPAVIRHPWPNQRFDVKRPRQEPSALAAHARICAGARREPRPYRDWPKILPNAPRGAANSLSGLNPAVLIMEIGLEILGV